MAAELADMGVDVQIASINQIDAESGTDSFTSDMNLPMVQDTEDLGVWAEWDATWRDVHLVDADNVYISTYNLTEYNLAVAENYETLKAMFVTATEPAR
jgi:hypothetical protein